MDSVQIKKLIPHRPPFLLIESIKDDSLDNFITSINEEASQQFIFKNELPAVVGIEFIAQSIALYSAVSQQNNSSREPKKGMIVSVQRYSTQSGSFPIDSLTIKVTPIVQTQAVAKFKGQIYHMQNLLAHGTMTVVQS